MQWSDFSSLEFQNPAAFWLLLLLPTYLWAYARYQSQRWQFAFRFSPMAVIHHLQLNPSPWKRLFTPFITLLLILLLVLTFARPTLIVKEAVRQVNMLLIMDISLSMMADDIHPSRLEAAKTAAIEFIDNLPDDVSIGLELFAGNNYVVQPPTRNHRRVSAYLKTISEKHLQLRTEIGSALKTGVDLLNGELPQPQSQSPDTPQAQQVIILLSDGDSQQGYPWNVAADNARQHNIKIYTVGIGSDGDASIVYQGERYPVRFSENTLRQIASLSGGEYFRVFHEEDFKKVYKQVQSHSIVYEEKREDLGYLLAGFALLLVVWGLIVSALWLKRL